MLIKDLKMAQDNLNLDWRCSNISIIKGLIYQGAFVVTASVQESLILKISEIQREEETELFLTNVPRASENLGGCVSSWPPTVRFLQFLC